MKKSRFGVLAGAFLMTATPIAAQTAEPEFNADFGTAGLVAVDCDLLNTDGSLSATFVMQLDPLGHYGDPQKIARQEQILRREHNIEEGQPIPESFMLPAVIRHIGLHGVSEERINNVAKFCNDNF